MIKRKRKNPVHLQNLKTNKKVYFKDKPFYVSKIRPGGIIEIISEDGNTKKTVTMEEIDLESKDSFKEAYGFAKLDVPEYVELERYIITENSKLQKQNTYLDFMIFRYLNGNKDPISDWMFDGTTENKETRKPVEHIKSSAKYIKKGEAFTAAQRMIQQKLGILV